MDLVTYRKYKNAIIEVIIEDDVITTAKIYMDGECVEVYEPTDDKGQELAFNGKNTRAVFESFKKVVDEFLAEDEREEATDMAVCTRSCVY